jgi:hypothetical protein
MILRRLVATVGVFTPMQGCRKGDLVVEGGDEDRGQHGHGVADRRRVHSVDLQLGDPLADVGREDVDHPELGEGRHDVPVQGVGVVLSGGQLHDVVGEPDVFDVALEQLTTAVGLAPATLGHFGLGLLPRLVRGLQAGERPGRAAVAADVLGVGGVADVAVASDSLRDCPMPCTAFR